MCFKKKKINNLYLEDRKCVLLSAQSMDILSALDNDNKFEKDILMIKEELLYLSPRDNEVVYDLDKKIRDNILDIRLLLNKKEYSYEEVESIFQNIKILIKERDSKELK